MKWVVALSILLVLIPLAFATTFLPQTLDDLDKKADYVVIGTVVEQESVAEDTSIITATTIDIDEVLKGKGYPSQVIVKEKGGVVGDIMMVVPGSPEFEDGEKVAIFVDQEKRSWSRVEGHTVGMAQGKFSIVGEEGQEMLINDLHGANLLTEPKQEPISLPAFRERYNNRHGFFTRFIRWVMGLW